MLKEILMGNVRDQYNITMHMHLLHTYAEPKKDYLGLFFYHIIRGTNLIDLDHKSLAS